MAMRQGNIMAEIDHYNARVVQEYNNYNERRQSAVACCMNGAGWGLVTVEEELF